MSIPLMQRYPVLDAALRRKPPILTNNVWQTAGYDGVHGGNDLFPEVRGVVGDAVFSCWPGVVDFEDYVNHNTPGHWGRDYGNRVLVRHNFTHTHSTGVRHRHNWFTFYAHLLRRSRLRAGDRVDISHALGQLGDTGRSKAPHVHFALQTTNDYKQGIVDGYTRLIRAIELEKQRAA